MTVMDGYVRVSRVAGRAGDSFISPDVQRDQIATWAKLRGVEIGAWHEDLDESGGTIDRPAFQEALARVEAGESAGIVVAKIDRFARSLPAALEAIQRLEDAGASFVSVADGIDPQTPAGKMLHRLLLVLAEFELDRVKENWRVARERAVARGVHPAARVPTGYRRPAKGARLEPDPESAAVIAELFARRASGAGWPELSAFMDDSGVVGPWGGRRWLRDTLKAMISNRVYLGEARHGEFFNADAHEPLIDRFTWEAAQSARGRQGARSGDPSLLTGLIRCAGCRYLLRPTAMTERSGKRRRIYKCIGRASGGCCEAQAAVSASVVDPYVEERFLAAAGGLAARGTLSSRVSELERSIAEAEAELAAYRDDERILGVLGAESFLAGLESRAVAVESGYAELAVERDRLGIAQAGEEIALAQLWPSLEVLERQRLLAAGYDAIFLRRGRAPIADRLVLFARGEGPADLPGHGNRGAPIRALD